MLMESFKDCIFNEHGCQLSMRKRKGPQTQVRGSVGNRTEHELDSFDQLVDEDIAEWWSMSSVCWLFSFEKILNLVVSDGPILKLLYIVLLVFWLIRLDMLMLMAICIVVNCIVYHFGNLMQFFSSWVVLNGMSMRRVKFVLFVYVQRLWKEHCWNTNECNYKEENAETFLEAIRHNNSNLAFFQVSSI